MKKLNPYHDDRMWKGAPPEGFEKAQYLRRNMTKAEGMLWEKLRNNQFEGLKFRRQHPINIYIADFYCHKFKLIIEIDGGYHLTSSQIEKDSERTRMLEQHGLNIIRFKNEEIKNNIEAVLTQIKNYIKSIK